MHAASRRDHIELVVLHDGTTVSEVVPHAAAPTVRALHELVTSTAIKRLDRRVIVQLLSAEGAVLAAMVRSPARFLRPAAAPSITRRSSDPGVSNNERTNPGAQAAAPLQGVARAGVRSSPLVPSNN